ncbi:MAG: hypothetical protein JNM17_03010 [Archangium sp.]|nr:hypothetical protein [Archangium sp.]
MTLLKPLTSCLVVLSFCACGEGALPMDGAALDEPGRVGGAPTASAQRFALTSESTNGWSLAQHAAVPADAADLTINASGCRGGLSTFINSSRYRFCPAGTGFASVNAVPSTVSNCDSGTSLFLAGGSNGHTNIGDGYVVMQGDAIVGQLRIADHTLVPQSWDGKPVQVTLEYLPR